MKRKIFALVLIAALALAALRLGTNSAGVCLSEMTRANDVDFKFAALRIVDEHRRARSAEQGLPLRSSREIRQFVSANPDCCIVGKHGFSEFQMPSWWARFSGQATRVVSLPTGETSRSGLLDYSYVTMDNCGRQFVAYPL